MSALPPRKRRKIQQPWDQYTGQFALNTNNHQTRNSNSNSHTNSSPSTDPVMQGIIPNSPVDHKRMAFINSIIKYKLKICKLPEGKIKKNHF